MLTREAREQRIKEAKEAYADDPNQERIPLPWQGSRDSTFPVVKLPVDAVVYNHRSHRIKAQLESHPERQLVETDPHGEQAQRVIESLLRATDGYEPLLMNIEEVGQRDAGVATSSGLLVNANTRLAALRAVDPHGYIRVAILPVDAAEKDLDQLELSLQIKRDFKQDYSFTNELLFIEDLIGVYHYSAEDVAKALNWAASSDEKELKRGIARVQQAQRMLALIREIQARGEQQLPLTFFDAEKRQALIDLDQIYESLKTREPDAAERVRETRILGILSGTYYRELRKISTRAVDRNLAAKLAEKQTLRGRLEQITLTPNSDQVISEDLDLLDDQAGEQGGAVSTLRPLIDLLAKTAGKEEVELPGVDGEGPVSVAREDLLRDIAEAMDETAEDESTDDKLKKGLDGPLKALRIAIQKIDLTIEAYREVRANPDFDRVELGRLLKALDVSHEALRREIGD